MYECLMSVTTAIEALFSQTCAQKALLHIERGGSCSSEVWQENIFVDAWAWLRKRAYE